MSILSKVVYGQPGKGKAPSKGVRAATASRILAVQPTVEALAGGTLVDATGTWRRIHGCAIGWSQSEQARRLQAGRAMQLHPQRVTARTARKVAVLYQQLENTPGSCTRARNMAVREGWLAPGYWDPDTIDDPQADPTRPGVRRPRRVVLAEDAHWLQRAGCTEEQIAERLNITGGYLRELLAGHAGKGRRVA